MQLFPTRDKLFLIYQSAEKDVSINAFIQDETIWITANQMAILFDKSESTIRKHINNVFDEGELSKENNSQKVRVDGVKQLVAFYNLDVIISVGYRVSSRRATRFRIWATGVLKQGSVARNFEHLATVGLLLKADRHFLGLIAKFSCYYQVIHVAYFICYASCALRNLYEGDARGFFIVSTYASELKVSQSYDKLYS